MPPSRLLTEGDARQAAHLRAVKELAARTRREILTAFQGLAGPRVTAGKVNRVLALRERLEQLMRRDLVGLGQTSYRGWSRALTRATGLSRIPGRTEPGVVETTEIVDFPFRGETWDQRLERHLPRRDELMRLFLPVPGRTRADVFADLERMASRVAARVATLARTEANRVNQVMSDRAAQDVIGDDGIAGWRYMTMDDERVRPTHKLLHGRLYGPDEDRPVVPSEANCRCWFAPVMSPGAMVRLRNARRR